MKIALIFLMASIASIDFLNKFRDHMNPQTADLASFGDFGSSPLLAHVNAEGTAHDWQDPSHGGIPTPGGVINPHGQRGGLTWGDGRAKYSQEGVLKKMKEGWLHPSVLKNDDRFWPQDSRPGDGSFMTPESQELWQKYFPQ